MTTTPVILPATDPGRDAARPDTAAARAGTIFITGATGFIGRRLLAALHPEICREARCLTRNSLPPGAPRDRGVRLTPVPGDLLDPPSFVEQLRGVDTVVHLAAATGNKSRAEFLRTNATATTRLLQACESAGVRRLLFVSTVAVKYTDDAGYHYAESKRLAEDAVRASRLPHLIVRPGIVLGAASPGFAGLARLAGLPAVPLFGPGTHLTQPIDVDDLVACLLELLTREHFDNNTIELGGPNRVSVRDLLRAIALRTKRNEPRFLRMPMPLVKFSLACAEPLLRPLMPLTRGQLCVFHNDSTIADNDLVPRRPPGMKDLAAMIDASVAPAPAPDSTNIPPDHQRLNRECATYTRYLTASAPSDYVLARYRHAHRASPPLCVGTSAFDRLLLRLSATSPFFTQFTDVYSRLFAPRSLFRRKLVLLLAVLESTAPSRVAFDRPDTASPAGFWLRLALRGLVVGLMGLLALLLLGPPHLILGLLGAVNTPGGER